MDDDRLDGPEGPRRAPRIAAARSARGLAGLLAAVALAVHATFAVRSAWVTDDAYITLRTVEHALAGHGLVWNVGERVQAYTHPLWMGLLLVARAATGDAYLGTVLLACVTTVASCVALSRVGDDRRAAAVAVLGLAASRGFVDFEVSGLENPLTHLTLAGFVLSLRTPRALVAPALWVSALALTRLDATLLVAPAILHRAALVARDVGLRRVARSLAWGLLPLLVWEAFSLVYYGSLVPNTALAKLGGGVPSGALVARGVAYFARHLTKDPWALAVLAVGLAVGARARGLARALAVGVALHVVYLVRIGGDFMVGRFLTPPLFVATCVVLVDGRLLATSARQALALGLAGVVGAGFLVDRFAPGLRTPGPYEVGADVADERAFYAAGSALEFWTPGRLVPDHIWAREGRLARVEAPPGGAVVQRDTIGYFGFEAGPDVHVVDPYALTEPFLARLPALRVVRVRVGHLWRAVPEGYLETVRASRGGNFACHMRDAEACALARDVHTLTRGPLFTRERLGAFLRLASRERPSAALRARQREAGRRWVRHDTLPHSTPEGTHWEHVSLVRYVDAGVVVEFESAPAARRVGVSVDCDETARVVFYRGNRRLGEQRLGPGRCPGLRVRDVAVPEGARGFDRIWVLPTGGDASRALGAVTPRP